MLPSASWEHNHDNVPSWNFLSFCWWHYFDITDFVLLSNCTDTDWKIFGSCFDPSSQSHNPVKSNCGDFLLNANYQDEKELVCGMTRTMRNTPTAVLSFIPKNLCILHSTAECRVDFAVLWVRLQHRAGEFHGEYTLPASAMSILEIIMRENMITKTWNAKRDSHT